MSGEGEGETLEYTPTWVVAAVCTVIVALSLAVERLLHYCGIFLRRKNQKPLFEALQKLKKLMLLGFISLLLTVSQNFIAKICVPENVVNDLLPCNLSDKKTEEGLKSNSTTSHFQSFFPGTISGTVRRLLAETSEANLGYCAKKHKVPLLSVEAIHHLHIFIFVLAIVHVTFCVLTILFGGAKIRQWKHWENEIANDLCDTEQVLKKSLPMFNNILLSRSTFRELVKIQLCEYGWSFGYMIILQSSSKDLIIFISSRGKNNSFFKQFYASVTKSDYITLRLGFIMTHTKGNPKFNFHKYMVRALEDDFKTVVGISWYLWIFVVIFLLLNVHGWHTYFWIAFIPLILLLAVGTKLEHIINQLAYEVAEKHVAIEGELVVKPSDDHFWFHRPAFVHLLIHFILFQNAFEIAFFFWIWVQYGFDSCIMGQVKYIVPRLIIGVFIQVLCSYSTLPLYAIVSQMGSSFKKAVFEEHVQVGLTGWAQKVKKKRGLKEAGEGSREASSHVSGGGLLLGRLKGLKEAGEGSAQSSSHEGSTLGKNASAPVPPEAEP